MIIEQIAFQIKFRDRSSSYSEKIASRQIVHVLNLCLYIDDVTIRIGSQINTTLIV